MRAAVYTAAMTVLVADVGGTNSRCGIGSGSGKLQNIRDFSNREFPHLAALLAKYLQDLPAPDRPTAGALAVAAPIDGDTVRMINRAWQFSVRELQSQLGFGQLHAINDFAAQAWALGRLGDADLVKIGRGQIRPGYPKVVLGPGTGLGVAGAVPVGATWQIIPGEGGHASLAAQDEVEDGVLRRARERFGHCSAERVLSGSGLSFLDAALHGNGERAADAIGIAFAAGETEARATLELFFRILGGVAGDLALTFGAFGGVYVSGGIAPRYLDLMRDSGFRERFEAKGRYRDYLGAIPTFVVTARYAALEGLVAFLLAPQKAS